MIKFFGNYIIEVKTEKGMDKLQIYDFDNKLSLFNASYPQIFRVEAEKDAVFMLVRDKNGLLAVHQLIEMEHNLKIQNLLKKSMFSEAQSIALSAKFPREIYAEICKEHADQQYYQKKDYDKALDQYLDTIGYLNPSYVIQRYIEVQQLPNLIRYLERLIETPTVSAKSMQNINTMGDYNKDYTALLLNCYVKMKQKDKI